MENSISVPEEHLRRLRLREPFLWLNPNCQPADEVLPGLSLQRNDIEKAEERLARFAPLLASLFEELRESSGIIESPLLPVPSMCSRIAAFGRYDLRGSCSVKADHALPVAGSVKARGGIYEVLCFAERLAMDAGFLKEEDSYMKLRELPVREFFARHTVSVGSTGNLGLSVGVVGAALGFNTTVHMSADAKAWKKKYLRDRGVTVIEYNADYSSAVQAGRELAAEDPLAYFVDDESSRLLFLGYSVAALRLKKQLADSGIPVDDEHPLMVYLPCGVGGAPGGITFGLKHLFGDAVHPFFVEPVESPCMLLGVLTGFQEGISVYDIGLTNRTEADGLAVSSPSRLAGELIRNLVSGCITVTDEQLLIFLYLLEQTEGVRIEPSAAAGFSGPLMLFSTTEGEEYRAQAHLHDHLDEAHHLIWTTGGVLLPENEYSDYWRRGKELIG